MPEDVPPGVTPFVFSDPLGKRWPRLRLFLLVTGVLLFFGIVLFVQTLFVAPQMTVPLSLRQMKGQLKSLQRQNPAGQQPAASSLLWQKFQAAKQAAKQATQQAANQSTPAPTPAKLRRKLPDNEVRLAFYTNGDSYSYASLEQHAALITHLCPDWMSMVNGTGDLQIDADSRLPKFAQSKGIALMPLLTNLVGDTWQPEAVENVAHGPPERQQKFINNVLNALRDAKAGGVVVDWEQLDPAYKTDFTSLLEKFADALHSEGRQLWLCVSPGQELDYVDFDDLSDYVDRFVALLFDETSEVDPAGPLASRGWFEGWLHVLLEDSDPQQWVIVLGSYGYDWIVGGKKAELISFPEAMSRASGADITSAEVTGPDYSPYFYYEDGDKEHAVWFLDVTTFLNELREVRKEKAGGFGVYRLGSEDTAIWDALNIPADLTIDRQTRPLLETLRGTDTITDVGEGEIVTVDESRANGSRSLTLDKEKYLTAKYMKFPEFPTLYHQGEGGQHEVALTFDDGPDPVWTPRILDILKSANVKAAFFVVGVNAERYPGLVRRIVDEGHEIGNHTYYHPNLALCWPEHIRLELNATQLLIQSLTGRATTLFRPPYAADTQPSAVSDLTPLQMAQELNYLCVLENIDPQDWARPGADIILQRIKQQRHDGSIILLHDAGGDRAQTVQALPRIIDYLKARGDTIVPLSQLLGTTREALMPAIPGGQNMSHYISSTGFRIFHALQEFLWAFMIVATALVVVRTLIVIYLAYRFKRLPARSTTEAASVVMAAYNEEKVIAATLRSLLQTDHGGKLEIVVIDDGSTDETAAQVEKIADPRVRLIQQKNRGKARALQRGIAEASYELIVFVDADTHCQRDTLSQLLAPFSDSNIGAVSGHAKVGNLRSFIARCQSLEYIVGFNLDRRAYTKWNCITVVPGAISAMRKEAIKRAGGLSLETLAEDTDLTLALHKQKTRIVYVPGAIARTEAPETVRGLSRQRFRWAYGTLQCLWKYRDMVLNPKWGALGWFSLPSIWFFQIILVAITPAVDLFLILSLPFGAWRDVLPFVLIFLATDVILATLACLLERENVLQAWRIIPMRLIYRPMLSYCIWKAILRGVKGALVSWGKLERTASVPVRV
jgi:peptidoglycan-N-acetylglucosamine deacetylase